MRLTIPVTRKLVIWTKYLAILNIILCIVMQLIYVPSTVALLCLYLTNEIVYIVCPPFTKLWS